ncbi:MAG: hypothetical protein DRH32_03305 [Deltaproteobacteria bacterium]|nr:MAG: hypothetical protein DRH32_03305 [Deltaproteobacteria bacterium]
MGTGNMGPVLLEIPGFDRPLGLYLHDERDACVSGYIREHRIWEPYETSLVMKYLKPGSVFLDIGANIGYYAVLASAIVGSKGLVIAYEPDPDNYRLLMLNLETNNGFRNAVCFQAAVADYNGIGRIYLSEENMGDHRLYNHKGSRYSREVRVVNCGDHLRNITNRLDFIKIDTQGYEASVVEGLRKLMLANSTHLVILVEFWPHGLRRAGSSGRRFLELLDSLDMSLNVVDHINRKVVPVKAESLVAWVDDVDADPQNQGFVNLLVLPKGGMK